MWEVISDWWVKYKEEKQATLLPGSPNPEVPLLPSTASLYLPAMVFGGPHFRIMEGERVLTRLDFCLIYSYNSLFIIIKCWLYFCLTNKSGCFPSTLVQTEIEVGFVWRFLGFINRLFQSETKISTNINPLVHYKSLQEHSGECAFFYSYFHSDKQNLAQTLLRYLSQKLQIKTLVHCWWGEGMCFVVN